MYGEKDIIVRSDQWQPMLQGIPHTRVERFAKAGHFIMLDDPDPFMHKLKEFLDEDKPTA
jgi:pimeloyl-ACP methyl ester carboxylesterase